MENLVMYGGYLLALIMIALNVWFYLVIMKAQKLCDVVKLYLKQSENFEGKIRGLLNLDGGASRIEVISKIDRIMRSEKSFKESSGEFQASLELKEKTLHRVRSNSSQKNLIISDQKRRVLELELACLYTEHNGLEKNLEKNLAMFRKMTISELQNERNSWIGSRIIKTSNKNLQEVKK